MKHAGKPCAHARFQPLARSQCRDVSAILISLSGLKVPAAWHPISGPSGARTLNCRSNLLKHQSCFLERELHAYADTRTKTKRQICKRMPGVDGIRRKAIGIKLKWIGPECLLTMDKIRCNHDDCTRRNPVSENSVICHNKAIQIIIISGEGLPVCTSLAGCQPL